VSNSGARVALLDALGDLQLKANAGVGGNLYANILDLSTVSPGAGGTDGVYAFIYTDGARGLWLEAPAKGQAGDPGYLVLKPNGDNQTAAGNSNQMVIAGQGIPGAGNANGPLLFYDGVGTQRASLASGTGSPAISGNVGDFYLRTDTPATALQRIYICTVTGAAGAATWVGII
jgi:hypothetical protein